VIGIAGGATAVSLAGDSDGTVVSTSNCVRPGSGRGCGNDELPAQKKLSFSLRYHALFPLTDSPWSVNPVTRVLLPARNTETIRAEEDGKPSRRFVSLRMSISPGAGNGAAELAHNSAR